MTSNKLSVFVSYKHKVQVPLQKLLIYTLEAAGYEVWTDEKLSTGVSWTRTIDKAINDSFALIVLMTKEAHESPYVTYEWSYALGAGKSIIPILVDDIEELHPRLNDFQYADFRNNLMPWDQVTSALTRILADLRITEQDQAFRWMQQGDSELQLDDTVNALQSYNSAYKIADDKLRVQIGFKIARIQIQRIEKMSGEKQKEQKKDMVEATEKLLQEILKIRPNFYSAQAFLGYIYRLKRDVVNGNDNKFNVLDQAQIQLKDALDQEPELKDHNRESWWNIYGGVLRRLGEMLEKSDAEASEGYYNRAIEAYENATIFGKKSSYPFGNIGFLYLKKGDKTEMIKNYTKVGYYLPSDAGDFWGYGDQLMASLVNKDVDEENVEYLFRRYDAFAPDYARKSLLETLENAAKILGYPKTHSIWRYIKLIKDSISK